MAENYEIQLGIKLEDNDFSNIQSQIKSLEKDTVKLNLDTDEADKKINKIKEQWQDLSKGNGKKPSLEINTTSLEDSLGRVESIIREIQKSLGSLDGKNTKNLVASVNKIASALEKATNESDGLVKSLNALSKKDFSFNFNFKTANQNPAQLMTKYGQEADRTVIPALKEQILYLEKAIGLQKIQHYYLKEYRDAEGQTYSSNLRRTALFGTESENKSVTRNKQMLTAETYIKDLKKIASLNHINLDGFNTEFSKSATEIIDDVTKIQSGAKETEEQIEKLKSVFGGIDKEGLTGVLEPIIQDVRKLGEFIDNLSENNSINELTSAFNRLSAALEPLTTNLKNAKDILDNVGNGLSGSAGGTDSGVKNLNNDLKQVTVTAENTADAIQQVANAQKNVSGQISGLNLKNDISEVDEFSAALSKLKNIQENMDSVQIKLSGGLDASKDIKTIQVLENQLESLRAEFNETKSVLNNKGGVSFTQLQSLQNEAKNTEIKLEQLEAKVSDVRNNLAKKIFLNLEAGEFATEITKVTSDSKKLSGVSEEVENNIKQLNASLSNMKTASANGDVDGLIQSYEEFKYTLETVENQLKQNKIAEQDWNNVEKLNQQKQALSLDMDNWLKDNSAAAKKFGDTIRELQIRLESCNGIDFGNIKREFQNVKREAESLGLATQTLGDRIKTKFKEYSAYFSVAEVFMYTEQALRSMFEQVKLIDSAMTELKKVTDETDESYNRFLTESALRAKEIGTTIDGLVSSTADFARLGYGFEDAQGLAEVANIYAVVGDEIEGVEGATQSLISTLTAFKDEMNGMSDSDFAMSIVDKMNEVANNYAISSGGIGDALQRSASSMMAANNSLDETIALITAANTVVVLCHAA